MNASVAYLSMEVALEDAIPTYSGGLGVLAGDTLRAAADLGLPLVGVTLLHRQGYLTQEIHAAVGQVAKPTVWSPRDHLEPLDAQASVEVEGRTVVLRAWRYTIRGEGGHGVPVLLLDTDVPDNAPGDRRLTDRLYGGDKRNRLSQEIVLGVGGRRLLTALGMDPRVHHLNEGHAGLLALELVREHRGDGPSADAALAEAVAAVRSRCVFTTHTPVPAGHDRFDRTEAAAILGEVFGGLVEQLPGLSFDVLNMTELSLELSGFVNGVAERHAEVSREMFPGHTIHAITNGVHAGTWASPAMAALFDRHVPGWRRENTRLRAVQAVPRDEIVAAHRQSKQALLAEVARHGASDLSADALTIGFARRATPYKRATLVLSDANRLRALAREHGGLQFVFAGKAHPRDKAGQKLIREVLERGRALAPDVRVVFVPDYGMRLGRLITAGVDLWLNNPRAPLEASGTSGMKAALNGVPNLSVRDGWWCEGAIEGVTGWTIEPRDDAADRAQLFDHLENTILPLFKTDPQAWAAVMRGAIAHAGSYFTAQRMVEQYARLAYRTAR